MKLKSIIFLTDNATYNGLSVDSRGILHKAITALTQHRGQTLCACARSQKSAGKLTANCIQKECRLSKNTKNKKTPENIR